MIIKPLLVEMFTADKQKEPCLDFHTWLGRKRRVYFKSKTEQAKHVTKIIKQKERIKNGLQLENKKQQIR